MITGDNARLGRLADTLTTRKLITIRILGCSTGSGTVCATAGTGRSGDSVSFESRSPVGIDVIGLLTVADHQVPVRRDLEPEMVEHIVCDA